jgi:hypothetical protein
MGQSQTPIHIISWLFKISFTPMFRVVLPAYVCWNSRMAILVKFDVTFVIRMALPVSLYFAFIRSIVYLYITLNFISLNFNP